MAKLEEILNKCSVQELKFSADYNKLSDKGSKGDLIARLASSLTAKKILEGISNKQLQTLLTKCGLPKTGNKDEMIGRILTLVKSEKREAMRQAKELVVKAPATPEKETAYKKGHDFEKQVEAWVNKELNPTSVERNTLINGLSVKRPYEVDVHVCFKGKGLFAQQHDLWIECKSRESTIKRGDISKLVSSAEDVFLAVKARREEFFFDRLVFASTSEFDSDALNYADQNDVLCIHFDGKKITQKNNPNFERDPIWLKRAKLA